MKVLQINVVNKKGSTGKIMYDIHQALKKMDIDSLICYGRGEDSTDKEAYRIGGEIYSKICNLRSRFTGIMYGGCSFSTNELINYIKEQKPDVVHLHCLNGYFVNIFQLLNFLKRSGIRTVLTLHAEFMYTANCGNALDCEKWKTGCGKCPRLKSVTKSLILDRTHSSWEQMKKAFEDFKNLTIVSVSSWVMDRAKQSPILAGKKHVIIHNGLDTSIFHIYDTQRLRRTLGIGTEKIIFHVTPFFSADEDNIKGGYHILRLAEMMLSENVVFIIAGNYDKGIKLPRNMIMLGKISNQNLLAQYYSMADITVIASKKETFSMVCAESLCCGTPVIGFLAGGPERISIPEYSRFVEFGNVENLKEASLSLIHQKEVNSKEISEQATRKFNVDNMVREYYKIYAMLEES